MGIKSFSTFIDNKPHLLKDWKLHNCKVVIDGNNLSHFLYHYFAVRCQSGGDYDTFADRVRYYFTTLRCCDVTPIVVFDGAYDVSDVKLATCVHRANERVHKARRAAEGFRDVLVMPILARETFTCVLDDLGISHVTCDYEADAHIAALANEWGCPVMSNDSDFYVYDLKAGFILFDYLNLKIRHHTSEDEMKEIDCCEQDTQRDFSYLDVQIYFIDTLLQYYKIKDRAFLPLFSTLVGNDYVKTEEFEVFFAQSSLPKQTFAKKKAHAISMRHQKMETVLRWLGKMSSLKQAMDTVASFYAADKRQKIRDTLFHGLRQYDLPSVEMLLNYFEASETESEVCSELTTWSGTTFPKSIIRAIRKGTFNVQCVNVLVSRRAFYLAQVECSAYKSSYSTALPLRRRLYGLLFTLTDQYTKVHDPTLTDRYIEVNDPSATITEYDRDVKNMRKNSISPELVPKDNSETSAPLHLIEVPAMSHDERLSVLLWVLGVDDTLYKTLVEFLPPCLVLPCLVVVFWAKNADPKLSDVGFRSLLLCFIKLALLDHPSTRENTQDLTKLESEDCTKADTNLNRYIKAETFGKNEKVHVVFLHGLSQYQACLHAAIMLNQLLMMPLCRTNPADLINGTLFYNLCKNLKGRTDPTLYIKELLGRDSTVHQIFSRLYSELAKCIPQGSLVELVTMGKKKKNKKSGKKSGRVAIRKDEDQEDGEGDNSDNMEVDANNRFALLAVT